MKIKQILSILIILISFNINAQLYNLSTNDSCIVENNETKCFTGNYSFKIDVDNELFTINDNNYTIIYEITNYYKKQNDNTIFYLELQNIRNDNNILIVKLNLNKEQLSIFTDDVEIKYYSLKLSK